MKKSIWAGLGAATLAACSVAQDTYDFSVAETQERLVNGTYEKGSIEGYSRHDISPSGVGDDKVEWQIRAESGAGFVCESQLTLANDEGTQTRIVTECSKGTDQEHNPYTEAARRSLQRLIEATLTGEPYVKE